MSDVPLGAMLSGGLDSSLLVALMARNMSEPVDTFSVGFAGDSGSELADARLVASALGTRHHELELSLAEAPITIEDLVWALDEPLADLSALGFLALSELATQHVTVAIAGQGADELFAGYGRYRRAALVDRARTLPGFVSRAASASLRAAGGRYARWAASLDDRNLADQYLTLRAPFLDERLRGDIVRPPLRPDNERARRIVAGYSDPLACSSIDAALFLDAQLVLVDDMLHYSDRVSMAHSLEVRVPFLDPNVVELAARVPARLKVHRGTTKYLVKQVARGLVPDEIIDKPKKGFFNHAVGAWLSQQLDGPTADYLLEGDAGNELARRYRRRAPARRRVPRRAVWLEPRALRRPDARGLALELPAAGAAEPGSAGRGAGMSDRLTYAAVTPARNESANLRRLAESMAAQILPPSQWVIVDNGSTDDTAETWRRSPPAWRSRSRNDAEQPGRRDPGGPIVAAFEAGVETLTPADIVVKLDADVSFHDDFFDELVRAFEDDPKLGLTSGTCYEQDETGTWQPQYSTRGHARGATRAYRAGCLERSSRSSGGWAGTGSTS